jgi:hypothetical protein
VSPSAPVGGRARFAEASGRVHNRANGCVVMTQKKIGSAPCRLRKGVSRRAAVDWNTQYRRGRTPWRSKGLNDIARRYLEDCPAGSRLLEIGFGAGDDAGELIDLGFGYDGIDLSLSAAAAALGRLRSRAANLVVGDFFVWRPAKPYAVVYEKGVFHGLRQRRRRSAFARRVAAALDAGGLWISICGCADRHDAEGHHGALYLTHLIEAVEPYFEVLHLQKAKYGVRKGARDFDAWYGAFRRRPARRRGA